MTQSKRDNNGCLWIVIPFIFTIIAFGVIEFFFAPEPIINLIFAVVAAVYLSYKILGKPSGPSLLKALLALGLVFALLFVARSALRYIFEIPEAIAKDDVDENVQQETRIIGEDTLLYYTSNRVWKDAYGRSYKGPLTVRDSDYQRLRNRYDDFKPLSHLSYWGQLYNEMEQEDTPSLDMVMDTFDKIHAEKKLDKMEFAEMVVSCIQDIPYSFVFEEVCTAPENYESSIRRVLEKCPECCIGGVKFGVQNPVSFLKNLKGDCDTRTVILYAILKYYNYDVAILNSNHYLHSILGLNIPAVGDFKKYNGKKYIVWETTASGYRIGQLPYDMQNLNHWNVVLTSK